jgi:hypothetical protein
VNVPNGNRRITQELLDVVDGEHRKSGWEWTDLTQLPDWFGLPDATGPSPEGVIAQLFDLFVEAGLHANGAHCDELKADLRNARRLLGRLVAPSRGAGEVE